MIKHLTPRTEEEILQSMQHLSDHQKMKEAINENQLWLIKKLLNKTLNINVYRDEFSWAIASRNVAVIQIFLDKKIKPKKILSNYGLYVMNLTLTTNDKTPDTEK